MIRVLLFALFLLAASGAEAQTVRATTEDGRTIFVHEDGTWSDAPAPPAPPPPPPEPERIITTQSGAPPPPMPPRTVQGGAGAYQIRYDASRWSEAPDLIPGESDLGFQLPYGGGYAATLFELSSLPLEAMRDIVIQNAQNGLGGEVTITSEKRIKKQGQERLRMEYRIITPQGIDVTMINTIQTGDWGTLQVVTWTTTSLLERYRDELIRFQDGLEVLAASGE